MLNIELNLVEQFIIKNSDYPPLRSAINRIKEALNKVDNTIDNIDYTAALEKELKQWLLKQPSVIGEKEMVQLAARLNSVVKAQQNFA